MNPPLSDRYIKLLAYKLYSCSAGCGSAIATPNTTVANSTGTTWNETANLECNQERSGQMAGAFTRSDAKSMVTGLSQAWSVSVSNWLLTSLPKYINKACWLLEVNK